MCKKMRLIRTGALLLGLTLLLVSLPVTVLGATDTVYTIATEEDLAEFAEKCSLDTWSRGLTVELTADITLTGKVHLPIPTFGGTFRGNGHRISDFELTESASPAGFFAILQEGALVEGLHVQGTVDPQGTREDVGGLVGRNAGALRNCSFSGRVSGKNSTGGLVGTNTSAGEISHCVNESDVSGFSMTGGIVGSNLGTLYQCRNTGTVNISEQDSNVQLKDLELSIGLDLSKLNSLNAVSAPTDTGGIAGYSAGILRFCANEGAVGYPHVGYNVGGIAGRNSGFITYSTNSGHLQGRKDVGGITGQMEPYIRHDIDQDTLVLLQTQMDDLSEMIETALADTDTGVNTVTARLNAISDYLNAAGASVRSVRTSGSLSTRISAEAQGEGSAEGSLDPSDLEAGGSVSIGKDPPSISGEIHGGLGEGTASGSGSYSGSATVRSNTSLTLNTSLGGLSSAITGMTGQMRLLNGELDGLSGTMREDLSQINQQINLIGNTTFDALLGMEDKTLEDVLKDTSGVDIDSISYGKVGFCQNDGSVQGDINTGGIAGSMALEYELDPEDDITPQLPKVRGRAYELKAVLQECTNRGKVTSKRDYAGSICGRMDLGMISGCMGYGDTQSESGDYVGGIAGIAGGTVQNSYAKCTLEGGEYVGGIVGNGVTTDVLGGGSLVSGCVSLVDIPRYTQFAGAISGGNSGSFLENRFVSDTLAGIDSRSYGGKTDPISYLAMQGNQQIPDSMKTFTLTFVAQEEVIKQLTFAYGDSFETDVYPELPQMEGCWAAWDKTELKELHFDTVVTAVYTPYTPTLASNSREFGGRPVLLAQGAFEPGDTLTLEREATEPLAFNTFSGRWQEALSTWWDDVKNGAPIFERTHYGILEQWRFSITEDGADSHTLSYLIPENGDSMELYLREGTNWRRLSTTRQGSYLLFDFSGQEGEIAAVSTFILWPWFLIPLGLLVILLLPLLLIPGNIRRRKMLKKLQAEMAALNTTAPAIAESEMPESDARADTSEE